MREVKVDQNKPIEVAIRKFTKACQEDGFLKELKRKESHVKPSVKRKIKSINARILQNKLRRKHESN